MKQLKTIEQLKQLFPTIDGLEVALLYGSFGRKEPTPNSDIDIQLLVSKNFENNYLIEELQNIFNDNLLSIREVRLRNKVVVYFKSQPKIEFAICENISEIDRNYVGSEIINVKDTILFNNKNTSHNIELYLNNINREYHQHKTIITKEKQIVDLIEKFIYEFESCSVMHRRSDGYQFYFFYNIAFDVAIKLSYLSKGNTKFSFLPKNFIANVLTKEEQKDFYSLRGSLFLPEANKQKRILLDFFYSSIQNIVSNEKLTELKQLCETIYTRDFLWNFRDISLFNPKIKAGLMYRTATMTLFQEEDFFEEFIKEKNIKTVIDFRAEREVKESSYSERSLNNFVWIHAPFDPWNQSISFQATHHQGTNIEIAYRFFLMECKPSIKKAVEAILLEKKATAIHCYAGKDRTGIFISMLHLLSGADIETVYIDYLATETDTKKEYLNIALDIINNENGIENYLLSCGLNEHQLLQLKQKLFIQ